MTLTLDLISLGIGFAAGVAVQRSLWFWVRKVTKSKRSRLAREAMRTLLSTKTRSGGPTFVLGTAARQLRTRRPPDIGLANICGDNVLTSPD